MTFKTISFEFKTETADYIRRQFQSIPIDTRILNLQFSILASNQGIEYVTSFASLPSFICELNLNDTGLNDLNTNALIAILAAIPETVSSIDLGNNKLYLQHNLKLALQALHSKLVKLHLNNNELNRQATPELIENLQAISTSITSLDLSRNALGKKTTEEIISILKAIPNTVKEISLIGNQLGNRPVEELEQIFDVLIKKFEVIHAEKNNINETLFQKLLKVSTSRPAPEKHTVDDVISFNALETYELPEEKQRPISAPGLLPIPTTEPVLIFPTPKPIKEEEKDTLTKLNARAKTNPKLDDLLSYIEELKKEKKSKINMSELNQILEKTEELFNDPSKLSDYFTYAKTIREGESSVRKKLSYLMLIVAATLAAVCAPTLGIAIAVKAVSIPLLAFCFFATNNRTVLSDKMEKVAETKNTCVN